MSRKVFLSFLGASNYANTIYKDPKEIIGFETRFVQEATIRKYCNEYDESSKIYILTTDKALGNWDNDGLKTCLDKINLRCSIENIQIPDGNSTEEIWDIFETIFHLLKDEDELIFDITHGFRTLPMLNMVLINYAKLLKKVSISGIYYGAFEAGDKITTPIWNLIEFVSLQDWTNAAQMFLQAGSYKQLFKLLEKYNLEGISSLNDFTGEILTNRSIAINEGSSAINTVALLNNSELKMPSAFKPISNLVKSKIENFKENDILNGLRAIQWCIDNNLTQQGITIMAEFVPTYVLNKIGEDFVNKLNRNTISSLLSLNNPNNFEFSDIKEVKEIQEMLVFKASQINGFKELRKRHISITNNFRNDINHGGYNSDPSHHSIFENDLRDKFEKLKAVINQITNAPQSL